MVRKQTLQNANGAAGPFSQKVHPGTYGHSGSVSLSVSVCVCRDVEKQNKRSPEKEEQARQRSERMAKQNVTHGKRSTGRGHCLCSSLAAHSEDATHRRSFDSCAVIASKALSECSLESIAVSVLVLESCGMFN